MEKGKSSLEYAWRSGIGWAIGAKGPGELSQSSFKKIQQVDKIRIRICRAPASGGGQRNSKELAKKSNKHPPK